MILCSHGGRLQSLTVLCCRALSRQQSPAHTRQNLPCAPVNEFHQPRNKHIAHDLNLAFAKRYIHLPMPLLIDTLHLATSSLLSHQPAVSVLLQNHWQTRLSNTAREEAHSCCRCGEDISVSLMNQSESCQHRFDGHALAALALPHHQYPFGFHALACSHFSRSVVSHRWDYAGSKIPQPRHLPLLPAAS